MAWSVAVLGGGVSETGLRQGGGKLRVCVCVCVKERERPRERRRFMAGKQTGVNECTEKDWS
jgi:hypothetical protein